MHIYKTLHIGVLRYFTKPIDRSLERSKYIAEMRVRLKLILVFIMVVMIFVCSCSDARTPIPRENNQEKEKISQETTGKEEVFTEKIEHPRSSVENHHYIPRQDFNNYGPGGDNNGGGGG
ncbi:hypothetical protein HA466_0225060 [Hirschfeldia incana]|nr:hypothetical protein HA466_0225060 [Hirschfeldia incana]